MASFAQSQGFRKLLFLPTTVGFKKWCTEIRRSKAFVKQYPLMCEESREWHASEYAERKLLLRRLAGLEAQLDESELLALQRCLTGRSLDMREEGAKQMYSLWEEQQSFLVNDFRSAITNQKVADLLRKARESQGITKGDTASIVGVSARSYAKYEVGVARIPAVQMALLLSLFGCDLTALF